MSGKVWKDPMTDNDCLNYIRPSSRSQLVTDFSDRTAITLVNPQRVINNTGIEAVISIRLRGDTTYTPYGFNAYQERILEAGTIGSSADGTTATSVIINGID